MPFGRHVRPQRLLRASALVLALLTGLAACGTETGGEDATDDSAPPAAEEETLFSESSITDIEVEFDQAEYDAMIETFSDTGEKDWIHADVTINGTTFQDAGMRLKGNSSLIGLGGGLNLPGGAEIPEGLGGPPGGSEGGSEEPQNLPWLIQLDEFVDDQSYGGVTDLVIRSNGTETSLNEVMALELLDYAGLPTQDWTHSSFSVNGSEPVLRLAIENPNDEWDAATFENEGILYKAESGGDYSYRGDDPEAYAEVFDQETHKDEEDLAPLTDFLAFINESDDTTFARELEDHLEVEEFARYLAIEDLLGNFDDIEGPGNNSYLRWDEETERFTVVAWDHNLALNSGFGGFGGGTPPGGEGAPEAPAGADGEAGPPAGLGGFPGGSNILVERFLAVPEFQALYDEQLEELTQSLFRSGQAAEMLDHRAQTLIDEGGDLVDPATVEEEKQAILEVFNEG
jgi:spore coat protein CotH